MSGTAEDNAMQASVGRIVHYVSYGTPGGEFKSECRAAVVTEVGPGLLPDATMTAQEIDSDAEVVGLAVLNPSGMFFHRAAYHEGDVGHDHAGDEIPERSYRGGSWHWPERS